MSKNAKMILGFVPMLLICAVIFWFSANVAEDSSEQSSHLVGIVKDDVFPELGSMETVKDQQTVDNTLSHIVRKAAHFSIYTLLGICSFVGFWFIMKKHLRWLTAWGFCIVYAVSDEIHQYFVPGRSCEFKDVVIDSCGAALGAGICLVVVLLAELKRIKSAQKNSLSGE